MHEVSWWNRTHLRLKRWLEEVRSQGSTQGLRPCPLPSAVPGARVKQEAKEEEAEDEDYIADIAAALDDNGNQSFYGKKRAVRERACGLELYDAAVGTAPKRNAIARAGSADAVEIAVLVRRAASSRRDCRGGKHSGDDGREAERGWHRDLSKGATTGVARRLKDARSINMLHSCTCM